MSQTEWRCRTVDLPPGRTVKVRLSCGGRDVDGFVVNHGGRYRAYVNRCAHVGTPLDLWPNEFLDETGRVIVCATHGAIFDPEDGACTAGPCVGDALDALAVRREGDDVVVTCPS